MVFSFDNTLGNPQASGVPTGVPDMGFDFQSPSLTKKRFKRDGKKFGVLGGKEFALDKKGRVKFDEEGNKIPKNARRKFKNLIKNPFRINAGNAIDPGFEFQNLPPSISQGLVPGLVSQAGGGGLFDALLGA